MWLLKNIRNEIENNPDVKKAKAFKKAFEPKEGLDYDWVYLHSVEEYKRIIQSIDVLEEKADSMIRYLGAGSGIIAIALGHALKAENFFTVIHVFPALIMTLIALYYAVNARKPSDTPVPPYTNDGVLKLVEEKGDNAKAFFAVKIGAVSIGLKTAAQVKGELTISSFRWFLFAITWLTLISFLNPKTFGLWSRLYHCLSQ